MLHAMTSYQKKEVSRKSTIYCHISVRVIVISNAYKVGVIDNIYFKPCEILSLDKGIWFLEKNDHYVIVCIAFFLNSYQTTEQ